jgi:tRNA U34 5-methylaminomethyl-2-thiouridine-forming methyltransferase MnmC
VGIERHFVEAGQYLEIVKQRAAEAKAAAEKAAQEAAAKAKDKASGAKNPAAKANDSSAEPDAKKVAAFAAALAKNPDKMAAKLVADPTQAGILASILDEKRIKKLSGLMARDMELATKAAAAFVQQELKRQGECQD